MKNIIQRLFEHQIVRYGFTGITASCLHLTVAFSLLKFSSSGVFLANLMGFAFAFTFSYLMQSLFVFKKSISLETVKRFFIVQFSSMLFSQLISALIPTGNRYLHTVLIVIMIPLITYLIHHFWTYKEHQKNE